MQNKLYTETEPIAGDRSVDTLNSAVVLENVSVCFRLQKEPASSLKQYAINALQGKAGTREIWAVNNVSINVPSGGGFGIVGRNGAGKSTLLKVITRVLRPTTGRVIVAGKVSSLLGIGAGFHPELSGRENIYLNAAILGMRKDEIDHRFERIVDFAELWDFIDVPLRAYSSGMQTRLGFSVATEVEPDILVVDEALSAGDGAFREKSLDRMNSFIKKGVTIIFVSHNSGQVQDVCQKAIWMHKGEVKANGDVDMVLAKYEEFLKSAKKL